jgi:hypothetical protein
MGMSTPIMTARASARSAQRGTSAASIRPPPDGAETTSQPAFAPSTPVTHGMTPPLGMGNIITKFVNYFLGI